MTFERRGRSRQATGTTADVSSWTICIPPLRIRLTRPMITSDGVGGTMVDPGKAYVVAATAVAQAFRPALLMRDRWAVRWVMPAVLAALIAPTPGAAQSSRVVRLSGRVFAGDTGKPLRGAFVNIIDTRAANPTQRQGRWIATDANGRWEFSD